MRTRVAKAPVWEMVSWMKERSKETDAFLKQLGQILFSLGSCSCRRRKNWVRALYHCFSFSSVTSRRLRWSSGGWKQPASSSFKIYAESFKKLVKISLAVEEGTLVQYFPSTARQSHSHLSAMLPTSESGGLSVPPGFPAQPPLCARALLYFPSLSFTFPQCYGADCALHLLHPFTVGYPASCSQRLPSAPQGIS